MRKRGAPRRKAESGPTFQDALASCIAFGQRYLGHLYHRAVSPMEQDWDELAVSELEFLNIRAHRESGKSTFWAITYPLWRIGLWLYLRKKGRPRQDEHIGIGAVNQDEASARLRQIKRELERNDLLREDFGPIDPGDEWTEQDLTLAQAEDVKSPTLSGRGIFNAPPGVRMTAYVGDDLVDPLHVNTRQQRDKTEKQLDEIIIPNMLPGAPVVLTHTTYNSDDLPNRKARDKTWTTKSYPLVLDFDRKIVQWPEAWPWSRVEQRMKKPLVFARQYQLKDEPDEGRLLPVPKTWPRQALEFRDGVWRMFGEPLRTAIGVDPATKARETSSGSRTAVVTIGIDRAWNAFVLRVRTGRWDPEKTWAVIIDEYKAWHPLEVFIEEVAFSNVFAHMLKKETPVPARGVPAQGEKQERIVGALNPPLHSGKLKVLDKGDVEGVIDWLQVDQTEELVREIVEFPGDTMDCTDALAIAYMNAVKSRAYATAGGKLVANVRDVMAGGSSWIRSEYGD